MHANEAFEAIAAPPRGARSGQLVRTVFGQVTAFRVKDDGLATRALVLALIHRLSADIEASGSDSALAAAFDAGATSARHDAGAVLGAQNGHAGRKACPMLVSLCNQQQRFGLNGQRNNSAEALSGHVEASRLARPVVQLSCDPHYAPIAKQRLGAVCRSRAKSAAMSRTVLEAAHANGSSTRLVDEGAGSYAWSGRV